MRYEFLTISEYSCRCEGVLIWVWGLLGGRELFHQFEDVPLKFELFFGRIPGDLSLGMISKGM